MSGLESQLESVRHEIQETHKALAGRHKFSLANAESRRKRKRTLKGLNKEKLKDKKKNRTRDLLDQLCCREEVMIEVADEHDQGNSKLKRALEAEV